MADPTPVPTLTPGKQTSEFKLAQLNQYVGIAMIVLGYFSEFVMHLSTQFPSAKWLSMVMIVCGSILKLGSMLGYNKGRVELKLNLADAQKELSK